MVVATVAWLSGGCGEKHRPPAATRARDFERRRPPPRPSRSSGRWTRSFEAVSGTVVVGASHDRVGEDPGADRGREGPRGLGSRPSATCSSVLDARDLEARAREAEEARTAARSRSSSRARERDASRGALRGRESRRGATSTARSPRSRWPQPKWSAPSSAMRDAEVAHSHGEIRSPVAGRVVDRLAEPGDTASPGVPLLRIYDPSVLRLEAAVRESLAQRLSVGQRVCASSSKPRRSAATARSTRSCRKPRRARAPSS